MSDDQDMTWHEATMVFGIDHSDPACPSLDAIFEAFVDATPEGLVDAAHHMGPMDPDADLITIPAPTPDKDGVYQAAGWVVRPFGDDRVMFDDGQLGTYRALLPDDVEALGAALIAAARDVRRLADNERSDP